MTAIGEEQIENFLYEISPTEAQAIADEVVADWDVGPVSVSSTVLEGELGGLYDPNTGSITLDEPLIAWSLIHELAHHIVVETGPARCRRPRRRVPRHPGHAGG